MYVGGGCFPVLFSLILQGLQSFFIARALFSGKNSAVQNETDSPERPASRPSVFRNKKLIGLCIGLLVVIAGFILLSTNSHLRSDGEGGAHSPFPWRAAGVSIADARAAWIPAAEHPRLKDRPDYFGKIAYFPAARLELGETSGSGRLYVSFRNSVGNRVGNLVVLRYSNGSFEEKREPGIEVSGQKALISIESGLEDDAALTEQRLREDSPLWTLRVDVHPDGDSFEEQLGSTTLAPVPADLDSLREE